MMCSQATFIAQSDELHLLFHLHSLAIVETVNFIIENGISEHSAFIIISLTFASHPSLPFGFREEQWEEENNLLLWKIVCQLLFHHEVFVSLIICQEQ
jgi:hypothetical protein